MSMPNFFKIRLVPQITAQIKAISNTMASTLAGANGGLSKLSTFKTMVNQLATSGDTGAQYASMISPSLAYAAEPTYSSYISANLKTVKSAATDLANNISKNKTAAADKSWWFNKYKNIDSNVLNDLYNFEVINIMPGSTYAKDPSSFVSTMFQGSTDQAAATSAAGNIISSWQ